LARLAEKLDEAVNKLTTTSMDLGKNAMSAKFKTAFAHSVPFLYMMGDVILAWFLLWRAVVASEKIEAGAKKKDVAFYNGQLKNAEYFIQTIIPVTLGKMDAISIGCDAAIDIDDESFGEK
jgi:acetyl-CoA dehydrogenase-like protein